MLIKLKFYSFIKHFTDADFIRLSSVHNVALHTIDLQQSNHSFTRHSIFTRISQYLPDKKNLTFV